MTHLYEAGDNLYYQLGRESAGTWSVCEQDEQGNLEWFQALGDVDLVQYTMGRLSTLDDECEGSHG